MPSKLEKAIWTPNFILLWLGYLVSSMGDHLNAIAFSVLVLEKTSSAFLVSVVLTTHFIPLIVGSIIAGPFVDRFSAKRIMIYADLFRGLALIGFVIYDRWWTAGIVEICALAAMNGFAEAWFAPASQSILRRVVDKDQFVKANSYYQMTGQGTEIAIKGLSGLALSTCGPIGLFLLDGLSFLFAGISEIFLRVHAEESKAAVAFSYFAGLKQGLGYLRQSPDILFILLGIGILNFFAVPSYVLLIPLFKQDNGLGLELYGFFMASMAIGMILGGALCARIDSRWHYILVCIGTIFFNINWAILSLVRVHGSLLCLGVMIGCCLAFGRVLFRSAILKRTSQDYVGRILSIAGFMSGFLSPASMLLSGYLGERYPIREVLRYSSLLAAALTTWLVLHPHFRRAFSD